MLQIGDVVTFKKSELLHKPQKITIVTEIDGKFVKTLGNIKPAVLSDVILVCSGSDRKDIVKSDTKLNSSNEARCYKYWFETKNKVNHRKGILYDLKTCGASISIDSFEDMDGIKENVMVLTALIKGDVKEFHTTFRKRDSFNKMIKFKEIDLSIPVPF